jgi:uncharacterized protein (UPF0147 family)
MSWERELNDFKETPLLQWPEDAGETLLTILRDQQADESERVLAAELAGDSGVIDDELANAVLSIVQSNGEPASLRAASAIALGPVIEIADTDGFEDDFATSEISEETLYRIQKVLHTVYSDAGVPEEVRRRVLEASVRGSQDWHEEAIRAAYASDDDDWKLTAVFSMGHVPGFDDQILESLKSGNSEIYREAVSAAGQRELDAAWPHIAGLLTLEDVDKPLLLAAIDAAAYLRPDEAGVLLVDLADSHDEEIAEAAQEAISMAEALSGDPGDFELDDDEDEEDEDDDEDDDEDEKAKDNSR